MPDVINIGPFFAPINRDEILQLVSYKKEDFIFISGSLIEGAGNRYSDLDIFVLSKDFSTINTKQIQYNFDDKKVQFKTLNGYLGCDIEYWPVQVLEEAIRQINKINFNDTQAFSLNQIKITNYKFNEVASLIHDVLNGVVIFNEEAFLDLRNTLNIENYYRLMARFYINLADNQYEDVIGNLDNNQPYTALISARELLFNALYAYMFSRGVSMDRTKWLYYKINELSQKDVETEKVLHRFMELYCEQSLSTPKRVAKNAEEVLAFFNELVSLVEAKLGGV